MLDIWSQIEFKNPWLLLIAILPLLYLLWSWSKKTVDLRLPTSTYVKNRKGYSLLAQFPNILQLLGFVLLTIALARPQISLEEQSIKGEGIDIMLVMDLSGSMEARDFKPNRIEVSKKVAKSFVKSRPHDRIGLTLFGKNAFTIAPLTIDHDIIQKNISELRTGILDDGTAIGMGLATSLNRLRDSESKSKIVILLTDGENNSGEIDPLTAADIASEIDVKVYTIGMGSQRSVIGGLFGSLMSNGVDEELLKKIAAQTGGKYFRAETEKGLKSIYDEIDQLEKSEVEVNIYKKYSEKYHFFLWWGLGLFIFGYFVKYVLRPLLSV